MSLQHTGRHLKRHPESVDKRTAPWASAITSSLCAVLLSACALTPPPGTAEPARAADQLSLALSPLSPPPTVVDQALSQPPSAASLNVPASDLLEDSLRPGEKVDLAASTAQADLWVRLRTGFALRTIDDDWVRRAEAWYSARPEYVQRMTTRGGRYLFHVLEEVERRGMPSELALLPFVESAFVTTALSSAKASGMWQFMPATGRDFDLKQNIFRDDRRDVLASTRAALDYLGRLHAQFGDWHLALAAYNWGQGNVQKAIARNQRAGLPTDYASLKLPDETRYYVPKLQAVKNIVLAPETFGLTLAPVANHPYFLSVRVERDMDVDRAAKLAGMSLEAFLQFNPQMNKPVILAAGTPRVLLPYDNASTFANNLAAHAGPLASWTAWVVPKTMKPADAAQRVGMSEAALRELNKIPPRMLVKAGSTLLVPRTSQRKDDVPEALADNANLSLAPDAPPLRRQQLKAGKADTVASLAARHKVSAAQLAQWNKVAPNAQFKPGQRVVVYLPETAKRVASSKSARQQPQGNKARGSTPISAVRTAGNNKPVSAPKPTKLASSKATTTQR